MNSQTDFIHLAQNSRDLPQPVPGQRLILDEEAPLAGDLRYVEEKSPTSQTMYYGLGAVILLIIAVLGIISFIANTKKKHRDQLLSNKNPYPKLPSTPINTMPSNTASKSGSVQKPGQKK